MSLEIRSLRSEELGNSAHLIIEREAGLAIVIDPVRDTLAYQEIAQSEGVRIAWALETHLHNDFISGGRELVADVGACLGASASAGLHYPYEALDNGDEIELGSWRLRVLATPGHTPEHISYLLIDGTGKPLALFSGGALMVGTAARTDLFGPALSWRLAHDLERSLHDTILELPDQVIVYPTHGGGSFCAVGAGNAPTTTIGAERANNPLASATSRQFVGRALTAGPYPAYYARMRPLNQAGAPLLGPEPTQPPSLDLAGLDWWLAQGASVVDVRLASSFRDGHIPASLALGADGNASGWLGWLVEPEHPLVLVADPYDLGASQVVEAARQFSRIGYNRVVGYLDGGIASWNSAHRELIAYETIAAVELATRLDADEAIAVIDVREASEWHAGHIPGSVSLPVHDIPRAGSRVGNIDLPRNTQLAVHCGHEYRGTLGASLLERDGYQNLIVVEDGWEGWVTLGIEP